MENVDTSHLVALQQRLSHEQEYLAKAKGQKEIELRSVWVRQIEREIEDEIKFLAKNGYIVPTLDDIFEEMDDDVLLAELSA